MDWTAIIGPICAVGGFALSYLVFRRNKSKDDEAVGRQIGMILTEIGNIKSMLDDIKGEIREQRSFNVDFISRLSAVEASAKQAHLRIDRMEGGE